MATVINDRDVRLLGATQRTSNLPESTIILSADAPAFHVSTGGVAFPTSITITANLVRLTGTVVFTASGATITDNHDNTATLSYSGMQGDSVVITASLSVGGSNYTKSLKLTKVVDGANGAPGTKGNDGATGNQYAVAYVYQWAPNTPSKPTGTTLYNWTNGTNTGYTDFDNWSAAVPTNPGTPNLRLYVAAISITAAGGTSSSVVSYGNSVVQAWAQNGGNGSNGVSGVQTATAIVYQWAATIPAGPTGSATYQWSNGAFDVPASWVATPTAAPSQNMTLWAARVLVTDSAVNSTTGFNWTSASIYAAGYSASNGQAGPSGASYVTAYCASATGNATSAPATTNGKSSLPAANSGGIVGTWSATVPTLTAGQYMYQVDGIYDPTTDKITWSIPYWSSLKVGSLSAISANLGQITAGSMNINDKFIVDASGNVTAKSLTIAFGSDTVLAPGVPLSDSYVPDSAKNSQLTPIINNAAQTAIWSNVSGPNRPQDNATVGANASNFTGTLGGDNLMNNSSFEVQTTAASNRPDGYNIYNNGGTAAASWVWVAGRLGGKAFGLKANAATASTFGLQTATTIVDKGATGGVTGGWQPNKTYVISFKAKKVNGASWTNCILQWNTPPATTAWVSNPDLTTSWQSYSVRVAMGATVEAVGQLLIDRNGGTVANDEFHIDELIVQEGDICSEWFPSSREAKSAADAANTAIANISSDSVLSKGEKPAVLKEYQALDAEWETLYRQADDLGVNRDAFYNSHIALGNYLLSIGPNSEWQDFSKDSAIDGAAFRAAFRTRYDEKQKLINAMAAKAATMATGVTLSSNGALNGAGGGQVTLPGMGQNVYRVFAAGYNATTKASAGMYKNGSLVYGGSRSYYVAMIRRSDGVIVQAADFDVYGAGANTGGRDAAAMATLLNSYGSDYIAVIWTYDEPKTNRLTGGLDTAMYRCGASRAVFGSTNFQTSSAYILIGIPGCGEGNGAEGYQGSAANDTNAWVDMGFNIVNGTLTGVSANYTPKTLSDYGYVGDMNATNGATLGVNVGGSMGNVKDYAQNLGTFVSSGTARTQISDLGIRVYDGSGNLRIKIGQL